MHNDVVLGPNVSRKEGVSIAIDDISLPVNHEVPSISEPQIGILEELIHVNSGGADGIPNLDDDFVTHPILNGREVVEIGSSSGNVNVRLRSGKRTAVARKNVIELQSTVLKKKEKESCCC